MYEVKIRDSDESSRKPNKEDHEKNKKLKSNQNEFALITKNEPKAQKESKESKMLQISVAYRKWFGLQVPKNEDDEKNNQNDKDKNNNSPTKKHKRTKYSEKSPSFSKTTRNNSGDIK